MMLLSAVNVNSATVERYCKAIFSWVPFYIIFGATHANLAGGHGRVGNKCIMASRVHPADFAAKPRSNFQFPWHKDMGKHGKCRQQA